MVSGIVNGLGFDSNGIAGTVGTVCPDRRPPLMASAAAIEKANVFFMSPPYRAAADEVAGCVFDGLRMIFCARHAEISDTNS